MNPGRAARRDWLLTKGLQGLLQRADLRSIVVNCPSPQSTKLPRPRDLDLAAYLNRLGYRLGTHRLHCAHSQRPKHAVGISWIGSCTAFATQSSLHCLYCSISRLHDTSLKRGHRWPHAWPRAILWSWARFRACATFKRASRYRRCTQARGLCHLCQARANPL
jgi:hypothetical protein